jgi:hypothetical protein
VLTTPDFVGRLHQVELVHGPAKPDIENSYPAFAEREDSNACELHVFEDRRYISLITAQAVERLGHYRVKSSFLPIVQHFLQPWAHHNRAGNRVIGVTLVDAPPFALASVPACTELIINGPRALQVCRVARVDRNPFHRRSLALGCWQVVLVRQGNCPVQRTTSQE